MNRLISFILAAVTFLSELFAGWPNTKPYFKNEYTLPENITPYTRIDTEPKTDWKANFIWDSSDGSEGNVWMCFRKTVDFSEIPETMTAFISADSRYWLYINGENAVFEGSAKRGPSPDDSYYDTIDIAPYLKPGENIICALVWYWGRDTSFSSTDSGKAGFIFEAEDIVSDSSWKVCRNAAFLNKEGVFKSNYRLPELNIYYDARKEIGDWLSADFDDSAWQSASENGTGGSAPWGRLYPRGIPLFKDFGLKDYENSEKYKGLTVLSHRLITLDIPYNAQCTPYLKIVADSGKKIRILTENTWRGSVSDTYITKNGKQEFEAPGWFNGEHITYEIPAGVKILELKYRETGYNTEFSGLFECNDERLNTLWQKSLRTLYVTMRDNYMDCPDRERAQWWGDVTNEMAMSMYSLDSDSYLLYQKGVASMLGHIDSSTNILQTVVPTTNSFYELPVQQLAGICGFKTYYLYTGDTEFLKSVYDAAVNYINLWTIGSNNLVIHREGSWDWIDWGNFADTAAVENAWYYYALSCVKYMADVLGKNSSDIEERMSKIKTGYSALWTGKGYKSKDVINPDDRANALAVISGLAEENKYEAIASVLNKTENASPYMEFYVLEALCRMERYDEAKSRMLKRYNRMIEENYSTLWEGWTKLRGTMNHAWSGGPLVIMSKYFAGIRPVKPGYEEFIIKPRLTGTDTVKCVVPSVKGYIRVTEKKSENSFVLDAELPADTTALIYIPYLEGQTVKLNDGIIYQNGSFKETGGADFVETANGFAVFSVKSEADTSLHFEAGA
ncbi:MAG: alpha-L-rhamnosidase N-terminal domain-containing protein [Clostridia bacterium]|nr:alpha-L-rhamnosidase N-terminal domain-containing protein [Clostridia bacterium]